MNNTRAAVAEQVAIQLTAEQQEVAVQLTAEQQEVAARVGHRSAVAARVGHRSAIAAAVATHCFLIYSMIQHDATKFIMIYLFCGAAPVVTAVAGIIGAVVGGTTFEVLSCLSSCCKKSLQWAQGGNDFTCTEAACYAQIAEIRPDIAQQQVCQNAVPSPTAKTSMSLH